MRPKHKPIRRRVAYFISPHGYGHAARAAAVMAALHELDPTVYFEIFTQVPAWFFQDSLRRPFGYHALLTDIGLAQTTPLVEDLTETLKRLGSFLPFDTTHIEDVARLVNQLECRLVLCDIAPMGIAVAKAAGIPSVLIENFTWDWIYAGYVQDETGLSRYVTYLSELFAAADYHIQTEPVCRPRDADLTTSPISRKVKTPIAQTRRQLGIPPQAKLVMITMGGIPWHYRFLEQLAHPTGVYFLVPGADEQIQAGHHAFPGTGGLVLLPHHSDYFHPDLVNASDAVIGKAGYSTLAEVYQAGVPFGYVARPRFRESQVLAGYIEQHMHGLPVAEKDFQNGNWLASVEELLAMPRLSRGDPQGADQAARFIGELLDGKR